MNKIKMIIRSVFNRRAAVCLVVIAIAMVVGPSVNPRRGTVLAANTSSPISINCVPIPATHDFVYIFGSDVYSMDSSGANRTQLTFLSGVMTSPFEHVSVSRNRRYLAGDTGWNSAGTIPPRLYVIDLQNKTLTQMVPQYLTAGIGGADWDSSGNLYFGAIPNFFRTTTDVYKMKFDGTGLNRLTNTFTTNEGDLAVSQDSSKVTYTREFQPGTVNEYTEIWTANTDGSNQKMVYHGGLVHNPPGSLGSAQNSKFSPDGKKLVFDIVNTDYVNFAAGPKTAHDIYEINVNGTGLTRMSSPGPISILPSWSWRTGLIVFTLLYDGTLNLADYGSDTYQGAATLNGTGTTDQIPTRIGPMGAFSARQIP